jgi:hypothetical protein
MASKKSSKKHYPVVRQFALSDGSPLVPSLTYRVDVGRCLSQANRRLYRYGRYYNVKVDIDADLNNKIEVYALRDDWAVQKAFQMAYAAFEKNASDEKAMMSENQIARWSDFRINPDPAANEMGPVFHQGASARELVNQGEFVNTQVIDDTGAPRVFTWNNTTTASAYSVLAEYDKAGNAQTTPSSLVSGNVVPYEGLTSEVDGLMMNNLEAFGDNPPYDRDGVNANGPFVKIATLDASNSNAQKLSTGFFTAPCGLVIIRKTPAELDLREKVQLTVKAGDYKGVHAPSMLE